MAIQTEYLDPSAGGPHTHSYRKIMQFGVDANKTYAGPTRVDIVDDEEVFGQDGTDIEAVGITVATEQTGQPE